MIYRYTLSLSVRHFEISLLNGVKLLDPITVVIEANAYQAAQIQALRSTEPTIRLSPLNTHKDKVTRAQRISSYFENKKVHFRREMTGIVEEVLRMPNGEHDDLFDALEFAISKSLVGVRKRRLVEPGLMGHGSIYHRRPYA